MTGNIKKLQLISLFGGMYYYTPIFTLFLLQKNINLSTIVVLDAVFSISMMLSVIPTGILADKFGQKLAIQIGLFIDAISMFFLLLIHNPIGLALWGAARGLSVGFRHGSDEALLYDTYVNEHGSAEGYSKSYGKLISNDVLGFVIAVTISGFAVQFFGQSSYMPLIVATGCSTMIALILAYTLSPQKHVNKEKQPQRIFEHFKSGFKNIKKSHVILALMFAGLLTLNGEYFLRRTYSPFFQNMAVPALFLGVALSVGKLLNFIVIKNIHRAEKHLTVDRLFLGLGLILGISFIIFAFTTSVWVLVIVFIIIQAFMNAEKPIVSDYVNERISSEQRSTTLSTLSLINNGGDTVARLILGALVGAFGLGLTFVAQGAYLVIGTIVAVWYMRRCGCVYRIKNPKPSTSEVIV